MTDQFDRAQQLEEMAREIALKKHRTFQAVSRLYCEDCNYSGKTPANDSGRHPLRDVPRNRRKTSAEF